MHSLENPEVQTTARVSHAGQGSLETFQLKQSITSTREGKGRERNLIPMLLFLVTHLLKKA